MNNSSADIPRLQSQWHDLQPLSAENDSRLWQKLRLEWNYHSNHIEGNTLTYGETELLLIHGQTHGNHTLREYEEMQAHDVGIAHLRELAADHARFISESDIRNLNKIILKEPFWKPAQTADGQASRKQIIPGEYKTTPNNVLTATGELFEFAAPADVPARMQALVKWLEGSLHEFREADLLWLLAKLHHEFVLIHPFDDGNGRVARMLVNYVLMRLDYPPIIVPTERKKDYHVALRLADAGEIMELEKFLGECVIRSLDLGIKAAKGESLAEPGDIEKEVILFKRGQSHHLDKVKPKSMEAILLLHVHGLGELFEKIVEKANVFDELFVQTQIYSEPRSTTTPDDVSSGFVEYLSKVWKSRNQFRIRLNYKGYRGEAKTPFSVESVVAIQFDDYEYSILLKNVLLVKKLYSAPLLSEDIQGIIDSLQREIFTAIKRKSGNS